MEKTRLLVFESVYWVNMNADIENAIKQCFTCLEYQNMQPQEKTPFYDVPAKPWEVVGTNIFMITNENLLCIVDYYSKFLVIKKGREPVSQRPDMSSQGCICHVWLTLETYFRCRHKFCFRAIQIFFFA